MDDAFGERWKGKVDCIGLHGDYEAGLQFIRDGKLDCLRRTFEPTSRSHSSERSSASGDQHSMLAPLALAKPLDASSLRSTTSSAIIPQDIEASPLPSAITETSSEMSRLTADDASSTWSPIPDSEPAAMTQSVPSLEMLGNETASVDRPLHFVFLGSSLGNFPRDAAAPFLLSIPLREGDTFLLGLDGRPEPGKEGRRKVEVAYNDPAGHTRAFEEHGWDVVRHELGLTDDKGVKFLGRYNQLLGEQASEVYLHHFTLRTP